jgi:hypothetical protein
MSRAPRWTGLAYILTVYLGSYATGEGGGWIRCWAMAPKLWFSARVCADEESAILADVRLYFHTICSFVTGYQFYTF